MPWTRQRQVSNVRIMVRQLLCVRWLHDPQIGAALRLLHGSPASAWTVEDLAREVGLSRSAFAERFGHFVQETPIHYLTRWRMQLAAHLLERQGLSIARIAAQVGYDSDATFNRAFKKCTGITPGAWRLDRLVGPRA